MVNNDNQVLERIMWGKSFVTVTDESGKPRSFILRALSIKETNFINYIYNREYDNALQLGIMTNEQLGKALKSVGMWTDEHEERIKELEILEKRAQSQIKDFQYITIKRKKAERELAEYKEQLSELRKQKISTFDCSAETRAEEVMRRYMIMLAAEDIRENPIWDTEEKFLSECDAVLIYNLAISYYKNNMFEEAVLRRIARSGIWRIKWAASKHGADLFGRPVPNWSEMQNYLVYWSQYYDYVYESLERPSDDIIENDQACDAWVRDQNKKNKSTGTSGRNMFGTKRASTNKDHQEQFIMAQRNDKEAIKKIQEMNSDTVRVKLQAERKIIEKEKKISEWKLRKNDYANNQI